MAYQYLVYKMSLTKKKISKILIESSSLNALKASHIVDVFFKIIKKNLESHNVKISNFGTFAKVSTPERIGRNPKDKKEYIISKHDRIKFENSIYVKKTLN